MADLLSREYKECCWESLGREDEEKKKKNPKNNLKNRLITKGVFGAALEREKTKKQKKQVIYRGLILGEG